MLYNDIDIYLSQPLSLADDETNLDRRKTAMMVLDHYYTHKMGYYDVRFGYRLSRDETPNMVRMSHNDIIVFMPDWIKDNQCKEEWLYAESHDCKIMTPKELTDIMVNYNFKW